MPNQYTGGNGPLCNSPLVGINGQPSSSLQLPGPVSSREEVTRPQQLTLQQVQGLYERYSTELRTLTTLKAGFYNTSFIPRDHDPLQPVYSRMYDRMNNALGTLDPRWQYDPWDSRSGSERSLIRTQPGGRPQSVDSVMFELERNFDPHKAHLLVQHLQQNMILLSRAQEQISTELNSLSALNPNTGQAFRVTPKALLNYLNRYSGAEYDHTYRFRVDRYREMESGTGHERGQLGKILERFLQPQQ